MSLINFLMSSYCTVDKEILLLIQTDIYHFIIKNKTFELYVSKKPDRNDSHEWTE